MPHPIKLPIIILFFCTIFVSNCGIFSRNDKVVNHYSLEDDKSIGKIICDEIEQNAWQYPLLAEKGNEEVYRYVRGIKDKILATGKVENAKAFDWRIKIIKDDNIENAFCTPGGNIYIFTGLIKFLDSEDQFAGIMAHEIAHAAGRHSTRQMSKSMPAQRLADALLGKNNALKMITVGLFNLKFNRKHEAEADALAVQYLCGMGLKADGFAGFFKKIDDGTHPTPPQWLSTHPSSKNRIKKIETNALELGCEGKKENVQQFLRIKKLLLKS
jgi:beta-barrel assembly-enhancing protease